jgi:hypothetical protein
VQRAHHSVAVRVELAAMELDEVAEGVLVAAAGGVDQIPFANAGGGGAHHLERLDL